MTHRHQLLLTSEQKLRFSVRSILSHTELQQSLGNNLMGHPVCGWELATLLHGSCKDLFHVLRNASAAARFPSEPAKIGQIVPNPVYNQMDHPVAVVRYHVKCVTLHLHMPIAQWPNSSRTFILSGESAEEASQERQRGRRPGAAAGQDGLGPSGLSGMVARWLYPNF